MGRTWEELGIYFVFQPGHAQKNEILQQDIIREKWFTYTYLKQ